MIDGDIQTYIETLNDTRAYPPVFKRASSGAIQVWKVVVEGNKFRTIHGQLDGKQIESEWTVCAGKNIGKANETSPEQQALAEVEALYKKKTAQGKYFYNLDDIDVVTYISPMLAEKYSPDRMVWGGAVIQPKLDGVRCIINKNGLFSRKGKPFPVCKHIADALKPLFVKHPDLILDGELYNHDYKAEFEDLISIIRKQKPTEEEFAKAKEVVQFHVYDIPSAKNWYSVRLSTLNAFFKKGAYFQHPSIHLVPTYGLYGEESIDEYNEIFIAEGYEGSIIRVNKAPYEFKRTYQLMKYKSFIDEEFEIADIEEGKGNWSGHAKRAILWLPGADKSRGIIRNTENDTCFAAGIKGSKSYAKRLLENKADAIGKPATINFFRWTKYGVPYLPRMKVIRDYE